MASNNNNTNAPVNAASLDGFVGTTNKGFMKNTRFMMLFTMPLAMQTEEVSVRTTKTAGTVWDLSYLCEAAEWAGRSMETMDVRYYGPSFKLPYQSTYNDLGVTILCRNGMEEKKFFDRWHNLIHPNNSYNFEYADNYETTISVYAFDESGTANSKQDFVKAFPLIVHPIQTAWQDEQISRLNVIFTYRHISTAADPRTLKELGSLVFGATSVGPGGSFFGGVVGKL